MTRPLPVVVAQTPARSPERAGAELGAEVADLVAEFSSTRMIVYPEYHTCRTFGQPEQRRDQYERMAEPLDGPRVTALRDAAAESSVWLVPGTVIERGDAGELFNTAVVVAPNGEVVAVYRKIFPWRPFEPFTPGSEFAVFDIEGIGTVGVCICYDIWFPEVSRQLAWMGADMIICPAQTSTSDRAQELVLARATAIQNQVFVVSGNAATPDGTGQSLIVDPEGRVRVQAPSETETFLTDVIDFGEVTRVRRYGTCGLNRMWSQLTSVDDAVRLPLYDGVIAPDKWGRPAVEPDTAQGGNHG